MVRPGTLQMKSTLLSPDSGVEAATITDEAAGSAYVENFAMNVFLQADNEDRQGKANKWVPSESFCPMRNPGDTRIAE